MKELILYVNSISPVSQEAAYELEKNFQSKTYKKNEFVLSSDKVCNHLYFMEAGLVKSFFFNNDKEFILGLYDENMMFTELSSYLSQLPSKYMLFALEQTNILRIHRQALEMLCRKHHSIETFVRKLYAMTSECFILRISEMLEENAKQRYHKFITNHPGLINRISLGDLSNYIGINQASLSRIRASR